MRRALERAWLRRGLLARLLWPLSQLYGLAARIHRGLYRSGWKRTWQAAVPVVVVGNVVAGGAGKTPVVMAVLAHLHARGMRAGVVSRGYGRQATSCTAVTAASAPADVGDEPLLIATQSRVPVFVAAQRSAAVQALRTAHPDVQVVVCDDGLQHHALARDIELCVFDERGIGNGWLLPAGPLREPWPRRVDLALRPPGVNLPGFRIERGLADQAVRADGHRIALADLAATPCAALAGIARPDAFFGMLRARGLVLARTVALPDHDPIDDAARLPPAHLPLLCTEKDAAKLWRHRPDAWAVPLTVRIEPAFWEAFDRLLAATLSSAHGSETA